MSTLRLKLRGKPQGRIDLGALTPAAIAGKSLGEIQRLALGSGEATLGDHFTVSGSPGDTIAIEAAGGALDHVGQGLSGGTIVVEGDAGDYAGAGMTGGRLDIRGNVGACLASGMREGLVLLKGSAGDFVGGVLPGAKFGMTGGLVHVGGSIGARAGERMRRGIVVVKGSSGAASGSRMVGGTIIAEAGLGEGPGPLMRRGTLIGPTAKSLLATFNDCGRHDLGILRIIHRHLVERLGDLAPKPFPAIVRRYGGDMATIGKGEVLLTA